MKNAEYIVLFIVLIGASVLMLLSLRSRNKELVDRNGFLIRSLSVLGTMLFFDGLILLRFGLGTRAFTGLLFVSVLAFASLSDLLTHTADNCLSVITLIIGFIGNDVEVVIRRLAAGAVLLTVFIVISVISGKGLGGADIKIACSCTIVLGLSRSLLSLMIGMILGVVTMFVLHKLKKYDKKDPFALLPFISVGALTAYIV